MSFNDLERGVQLPSTSDGQANGTESEYRETVQSTSQNIFNISNNVAGIQKLVSFIGTAKDNADMRNRLHKLTEDTRELVKRTGNDVKLLSNLVEMGSPTQRRQRKLEQQKLSKDFQNAMSQFQTAQKISAQKSREYVDKARSQASQAYHHDEHDDAAEDQPLIDNTNQRMQLQTLEPQIQYNETVIAEREEEIREIEQGIHLVNEIFRDLGTLVQEQGNVLDNIESNVSNIAVNTENAHSELRRASKSQKSSRNTKCCILLVLVVLAAILVIIAIPKG